MKRPAKRRTRRTTLSAALVRTRVREAGSVAVSGISRASLRCGAVRCSCDRSEGIGRQDLAAGAGAQAAVDPDIDRVFDVLDRAVAEDEVEPAGVQAAEAELTGLDGQGRNLRVEPGF